MRRPRGAVGGVEARVEPPPELGEVRLEAVAGVGVAGSSGVDLDQAGRQEALDLGHRRDQPVALGAR